MSEITIIHLNDGRMVIGYIEDQTDDQIVLLYPVGILLTNPYSLSTSVLGYKYSPFSDDGSVSFNKTAVQAFTVPQEMISSYYEDLVKYHQSVEMKYAPGDAIGGPTAEEFAEQLEDELQLSQEDREDLYEDSEKVEDSAVIIPFNKNKNTLH